MRPTFEIKDLTTRISDWFIGFTFSVVTTVLCCRTPVERCGVDIRQ
jgi:hypothetical protein